MTTRFTTARVPDGNTRPISPLARLKTNDPANSVEANGKGSTVEANGTRSLKPDSSLRPVSPLARPNTISALSKRTELETLLETPNSADAQDSETKRRKIAKAAISNPLNGSLPRSLSNSRLSGEPVSILSRLRSQTTDSLPYENPNKMVQMHKMSRGSVPNLPEELRRLHFADGAARPRSNSALVALDSFRTSFRHGSLKFRGRFSKNRVRNRLVQKGGDCNVSLVNVPKQGRKYFSDIFTTLVDVKWRWCLLVFALSFILSWLFFSVIYYLIVLAHGDFAHLDDDAWTPCIKNVVSYRSVFVFSLASQHTIGWGFRYPTDECAEVIFIVSIQSMVGALIQTLMAGVVFAKLARPRKRAETILFSKNAVICMQDGQLCFLFRVGDMRKTQLAEAHVRLQMIKKRITAEGELLPFHQYDMDVGFDTGQDRVFVVWPITVCHIIKEGSPLYDMGKRELDEARFEVAVILEGVVESTGATTQARTSYIPSEIKWGERFEKLVTYQRDNGNYRIDFGKFHNTYSVSTPEHSAKRLDEMNEAGLKPQEAYQWRKFDEIENQGATPYSTIHTSYVDSKTRSPNQTLLQELFKKKLNGRSPSEEQPALNVDDEEEEEENSIEEEGGNDKESV